MPLYNTIGWAIVALILTPLVIGISLKAPKLIALPMIAVLFVFSSSSWGQLQVENTIYSRGVGLFHFSLLNLFLFMAGLGLLVRKLANPHYPSLAPPLSGCFIGFTLLLLAHLLTGLALNIDLFDILSYSGVINVLNMLLFMYLVIVAFRSEKDQKRLLFTIIALAGIRAVFGIARFVWFDGDSANPYRNFEGMDIKIIFFDIADNFIASLAAFWAAWMLTSSARKLSIARRAGLALFLLLEIVAVALSFRRSSLLGLALMFAFLLFRMPPKRRMKFMLFSGAVLLATAAVFFQQRLQYSDHEHGNFISSLIYDISPEKGLESQNRLYELIAAARSMGGNWLTGLGSWGTFTGDQTLLEYHAGKFEFIHSGFGHIVLKTGLIGLALFCGIFIKFIQYYLKHGKALTGNARLVGDAGFAGILFWLPTLLIGTPIIEFRSMLLIGLTLALPFIAVRLPRYQATHLARSPVHRPADHYAVT